MHPTTIQHILGLLLMVFSATLLPPLAVAFLYGETDVFKAFALALGFIFALGLVAWLPVHNRRRDLRLRDGFMVVAMFWSVLGTVGAAPFLLVEELAISPVDAVFESVSGLTTTGATVIVGLDDLPRAILYYRQQLQWLGGMGIIVLAVAILPMLGVGGMQLYRAETPGPIKDQKLTPRITETAKALWYIYISLTGLCALAYWGVGMTLFDAVGHAFATVAIGGFSTHDASIGYYDSPWVMGVAIVFMLISGANFALHFAALRRRHLRIYWRDPECRAYLTSMAVISVVTITYLYATQTLVGGDAVLHGVFQVVSIATTTGFTSAEYFVWPGFLPVLLLFSSFVGGCAGSTGGGMKVVRCLLLYKQGKREIVRLIHPTAQIPVKMGQQPVSEQVINAVWGFFSVYVATFIAIMLALMAFGLDQVTAFSAVAACINNLGPGLGEVSSNFAAIDDASKVMLCVAMLLGRLEIFTLLVLLTPHFWRR
ncbi:MAG: TrkH family potassium uptake protein [Candidatus Competibacterales bacterium]